MLLSYLLPSLLPFLFLFFWTGLLVFAGSFCSFYLLVCWFFWSGFVSVFLGFSAVWCWLGSVDFVVALLALAHCIVLIKL
jgi:hypothetical protein